MSKRQEAEREVGESEVLRSSMEEKSRNERVWDGLDRSAEESLTWSCKEGGNKELMKCGQRICYITLDERKC